MSKNFLKLGPFVTLFIVLSAKHEAVEISGIDVLACQVNADLC